MTKTISCSEVGYFPDCDGLMRGETDEEVMRAAAEHGRTVHGMADEQLGDPETQRTVRGVIREGCHVGSRTGRARGRRGRMAPAPSRSQRPSYPVVF